MNRMFTSATLKLTAWYSLILIAICLLFSAIIYVIAAGEIHNRISSLERDPRSRFYIQNDLDYYTLLRDRQVHSAEANLVQSLIVTNIIIWVFGAIGSHALAKKTLRPIAKAHEAQSRFTSDASHELRTPLAVMKTELEVALRDNDMKKSDMRGVLESNLEEVNKLSKLARTLLDLSQLDGRSLHKTKINVSDVTKATIERLDRQEGRIRLSAPKQPATIVANQESIEELITILVDNALKYSPKDSIIHVSLAPLKTAVEFRITNEGKGIAKKDLPHIFDRFYRADSSRTGGKSGGYGLGLALAKRIVELHHGELSVTSGPHRPTTFSAVLPTDKRP